MAIALVAHVGAVSTTSNNVTSAAIDTTGANLLVLVLSDSDGSTVISDSKSNTWTSAVGPTGPSPKVRIFYAKNPTVGTGHTFTGTSSAKFPSIYASAFSGADTTAPLDQINSATSPGAASLQPGSVTPSANGELLVTGFTTNSSDTMSIGSSFTLLDQHGTVGGQAFGGGSAYLVQATAAAINPTWSDGSGSGLDGVAIATFKAGSSVTTNTLTLTDVLAASDPYTASWAFGPGETRVLIDQASAQSQSTLPEQVNPADATTAALTASAVEPASPADSLHTASTSTMQETASSGDSASATGTITTGEAAGMSETLTVATTAILTLVDALTALETALATFMGTATESAAASDAGTATGTGTQRETVALSDTQASTLTATGTDQAATAEVSTGTTTSSVQETPAPLDVLTGTATSTVSDAAPTSDAASFSAGAVLLTLIDALSALEQLRATVQATAADLTAPLDQVGSTTSTTSSDQAVVAETVSSAGTITAADTLGSREQASAVTSTTTAEVAGPQESLQASIASNLTDTTQTTETLSTTTGAQVLTLADTLASLEVVQSALLATVSNATFPHDQAAATQDVLLADLSVTTETIQAQIGAQLLTLIDTLAVSDRVLTITVSSMAEAWQLVDHFRAHVPLPPSAIAVTVEEIPTITLTVASTATTAPATIVIAVQPVVTITTTITPD